MSHNRKVDDAAEQGFTDWYKEDARRLDELGKLAKRAGQVRVRGAINPPALNPDGSLSGEVESDTLPQTGQGDR